MPPRAPPRHRRANLGRVADADGRRHKTFAGIETDAGGQHIVSRRQQRRAFGRGLQRLGDHHRDRLVGVAHLVVLQEVEPEHERVGLRVRILRKRRPVGRGHDLDDAGVALGRRDVEKRDAAARDAADGQDRIEHSGRMVVRGIAGFAFDLQDAVAAGQRLADIRAVPDMGGSLGEADDLRRHEALRKRMRRERLAGRERAPAFRLRPASARARGSVAPARS